MNENEFLEVHALQIGEEKAGLLQKQDCAMLVSGKTGSGKTFLLLSRNAFLLESGQAKRDTILNILYDQELARDTKETYQRVFGKKMEMPAFTSIHNFAYQLLKEHDILEEKETWKAYWDTGSIIRKLVKTMYTRDFSRDEIRAIRTTISNCINEMLSDDAIDKVQMENIDFPAIFREYQKAKNKRMIYDYDDVLKEAVEMLARDEQYLQTIRNRYAFLHIDDAQELSFVSHMLIKIIKGEDTEVVFFADQDLSVGTERSAFPQALQHLEESYPDLKRVELKGNYRNNKTITECINKFYYSEDNALVSANEETCEVKFKGFADLSKLYAYALKKAEENTPVAFLYRDFSMAVPLIERLKEVGLPFRFQGNMEHFLSHRFVLDMWNYIELLVDSRDMRAFYEVYDKMGLDISKRVLLEVSERLQVDQNVDIYQALMESSYKAAGKKALTQLIEPIRMAEKKNTLDMITFVLAKLGYRNEMERSKFRLQDPAILAFHVLANQYPDPDEFLFKLGQLKDYKASGTGNVVIRALESCHGYEFDQVCILDCLNDILPKKTATPKEKERERKLFTIGMSRAKSQIEFFASKRCHLTRIEISPYLFELNDAGKDQKENEASTASAKPKKLRPADLRRGTRVLHKQLGEGKIIKISDGMLHVQFKDEVKQLNLQLCISNKLIEQVS